MGMKGSGRATNWQTTNDWDRGVSWFAYPDEKMQRASHVLDTDAGAVVVDPVDADGIDDLLAEHGDLAGVVLLLDRHTRDSDSIANRHDVPIYVPEWMSGVEDDLEAPVERVHRQIPDTEYGVHKILNNPFWQEAALYGDETGTLVVPEAVGTAPFFVTGHERLGVHPMLRLTPPRKLGRLSPDRILVGHGTGILVDAEAALTDALRGSRRRSPGLYAKTLRSFITG